MRNRILALILTLILPQTAGAYEFTHLTKDENGLSYDGIATIVQDSRGFIWIGTYRGLNRYDGHTFRVYGKEDLGLNSDFIHVITEDAEGNLWIGTDHGVTKYDYRQNRFEPLDLTSSEGSVIRNKVTSIISDGDKVWMLVNDQGCFAYDIAGGTLIEYPYRKIGFSGFRKILRSRDGGFWVSRYHSNLYHADSTFREVKPVKLGSEPDYFVSDEIEGLFYSPEGKLLVASTKHGLTKVDTESGTLENLLSLPRNTFLTASFMEGHKAVWLSTTRGVFRYDLSTGQTKHIRNSRKDIFSLSNDYACCTFVDKDGGLWIGTKDGGVNYSGPYQDSFEKQYLLSCGESLEGVLVSGFAEDGSGRIWVATEEKGLLIYDPESRHLTRLDRPGIPSKICSICHVDGQMWFGTRQGLGRIDTRTLALKDYGVLESLQGVKDPNVYLLFRTLSGEFLAGTTLGIFRYDRETDRFSPVPVFDGIFPTCIAEDPSRPGELWISTYAGGIYHWDTESGDKLVNYSSSTDSGLKNDKIASIFISGSSEVWAVGFSMGLSRFDPETGTFSPYTNENVPILPTDVFFKAVEDDRGRLWLASDHGLVEFHPASGGGYIYTLIDGLLNLKFTNSAFRSSTGDLYFGSDDGFIRFHPENLPTSAEVPSVVLSSMQIGDSQADFDENIDLMQQISLTHEQNSFGFHFSLLGLSAPFSHHVQCRLTGFSEDWDDIVAQRSVFYYNVPPGQYYLHFRALSQGNEWVTPRPPLKITIKPGFWNSVAGTLLLTAMVLTVIAATILLSRKWYERKKQREQEEYLRKKEEETFTEKMNFFSHVIHEIKTPLTLIQAPLGSVMSRLHDEDTSHDLQVMHSSTLYLSRLVNELLDYVRIERHGYVLDCHDIDIVERLNSVMFGFTDTIAGRQLSLDFTPPREPVYVHADPSALDKIFNNLLLNAVKYAGTYISILIDVSEGKASLHFINDGTGIPADYREEIFKPFVQYHSSTGSTGEGVGIGLPLSRKLARMHSGDLVLGESENRTEFILTLPAVTVIPMDEEVAETEDKDPERTCILIADDNQQFRDYLAGRLSQDYDVLVASSADTAYKVLKDKTVDILLTDISMPGGTGLDLCRRVREDIEISHIPVIIISARSSVESKIQAMQAGADSYVEKPFDLQYLLSAIRNIIDRRLLMRNALGRGLAASGIDSFGLPKRDEEFFTRFDSVIRENLSNPELSNEFLAEKMNMSQSTLVRKIRKLMHTSPNTYVRNTRMAVAAEMLKNSHGNNITEICYSVGFSNVSYFTKCFREQYGMTPSEIMKRQ